MKTITINNQSFQYSTREELDIILSNFPDFKIGEYFDIGAGVGASRQELRHSCGGGCSVAQERVRLLAHKVLRFGNCGTEEAVALAMSAAQAIACQLQQLGPFGGGLAGMMPGSNLAPLRRVSDIAAMLLTFPDVLSALVARARAYAVMEAATPPIMAPADLASYAALSAALGSTAADSLYVALGKKLGWSGLEPSAAAVLKSVLYTLLTMDDIYDAGFPYPVLGSPVLVEALANARAGMAADADRAALEASQAQAAKSSPLGGRLRGADQPQQARMGPGRGGGGGGGRGGRGGSGPRSALSHAELMAILTTDDWRGSGFGCRAYNAAGVCTRAACSFPHTCTFCGLPGHALSACPGAGLPPRA